MDPIFVDSKFTREELHDKSVNFSLANSQNQIISGKGKFSVRAKDDKLSIEILAAEWQSNTAMVSHTFALTQADADLIRPSSDTRFTWSILRYPINADPL